MLYICNIQTNKKIEIMLVIKDKRLEASYDYFTRNGKGTFNFDLYARLLSAKGINPNDKLEVIKRAKNIKTR